MNPAQTTALKIRVFHLCWPQLFHPTLQKGVRSEMKSLPRQAGTDGDYDVLTNM